MAGSDTKRPVGRPSVMTPEVLRKLEEAFAIGASDLEACFYADISKTALYEYQKDNPQFTERKEKLKEKPVLLARQTVLKAMETDPATARWYLERKAKSEFAARQEQDITTGGERLEPATLPPELLAAFAASLSDTTKG